MLFIQNLPTVPCGFHVRVRAFRKFACLLVTLPNPPQLTARVNARARDPATQTAVVQYTAWQWLCTEWQPLLLLSWRRDWL